MTSPAIESIHELMLGFGYSRRRRIRRKRKSIVVVLGGGSSDIGEEEKDGPKAWKSR